MTGIILAGGKNSRMGENKAFLTLDGERLIDAHLMLFMGLSELGRMAEARGEVETVTRLTVELRQPAQLWLGIAPRALLALLDGDLPLAEELIERETDNRRQVTIARDDESAARMHRFLLRREQGRLAEEEPSIRSSVGDFPWYPLYRAALACLLRDLGRDAEARAVFENLARDEFRALYRDSEWLLGMSLASEACALLGDGSAAEVLYDQLEPFAGRHAIGHAEGSVGAVDRYLGLLAATLGRLDDAVRHLDAAVDINEAWGALPWAAHSRHDLAWVLTRRDAPGDRDRAEEAERVALAAATTLGMALAGRIRAEDQGPPDSTASPVRVASGTFHREGEYWTIGYEGAAFTVRDSKGMRHLARLLESPGREVHALDLVQLDSPGSPPGTAAGESLSRGGSGDAGPVLDAESKAAYRRRLDEIREELDEAERWNDPARVDRLQVELQALTHELASAFGLGGRDRPTGSSAERARVSVTRAIRAALRRIDEQSPALGAHFDATIHTGTFCSYMPDPRAAITWRS